MKRHLFISLFSLVFSFPSLACINEPFIELTDETGLPLAIIKFQNQSVETVSYSDQIVEMVTFTLDDKHILCDLTQEKPCPNPLFTNENLNKSNVTSHIVVSNASSSTVYTFEMNQSRTKNENACGIIGPIDYKEL